MSSEDAQKPTLVERMRAQRETHANRPLWMRALFVVAGFTLLLAGIAMLVLPGPALAVIPVALAILSLEFAWAEQLLEKALVKGEEARRKATQATRTQKILSGLAIACAAAAAVAAALIWDIPYLPV